MDDNFSLMFQEYGLMFPNGKYIHFLKVVASQETELAKHILLVVLRDLIIANGLTGNSAEGDRFLNRILNKLYK